MIPIDQGGVGYYSKPKSFLKNGPVHLASRRNIQ